MVIFFGVILNSTVQRIGFVVIRRIYCWRILDYWLGGGLNLLLLNDLNRWTVLIGVLLAIFLI